MRSTEELIELMRQTEKNLAEVVDELLWRETAATVSATSALSIRRGRLVLEAAGEELSSALSMIAPEEAAPLEPQAIRRARKTLRLSQSDLAKAFGITRGTVSRWERGFPVDNPQIVRLAFARLGAAI